MTIIHFILGFPPHRSGGLTKYAIDLMTEEVRQGHDVYAMYPGNFHFFGCESKIIEEKSRNGLHVLQLTNAMPVPLLYGIRYPKSFTKERRIINFQEIIDQIHPETFHVHTLMGLPKELLILVKKAGIRIIYTSHDYFGLCPRVNFITNKGEVCRMADPQKCTICCAHSRGDLFLKLRNSKLLVPIKRLLR